MVYWAPHLLPFIPWLIAGGFVVLQGEHHVRSATGHSIENVGDKAARILIEFNAGIYETIDLSQWIAANPFDVLATNFGRPAELFEKFPDRDVFIAGRSGPGK